MNIASGYSAGFNLTTGSNNIDIFDAGASGENGTIRIGTVGIQTATFIAGIYGETTSDAGSTVAVMVDMNGNLGTPASRSDSRRKLNPWIKAAMHCSP